jgi:hypothetical protein
MPVSNEPIYPQLITNEVAQILPTDASNLMLLYTGAMNGSKIENIFVTNTDTNPYIVTLSLISSSTAFIMATYTIPASAGTLPSVPAYSLLNNANLPTARDAYGNPYIYIASNTFLNVNSSTTVSTNMVLSFITMGGDF